MSKTLRRVLPLLLLLLFLPFASGAAFLLWYADAKRPAQTGKPALVRVTVAPGDSPASIGPKLEAAHAIRSARAFGILGRNAKIQSGVYDISPADTPDAILKHLQNGDVATVRVTFPEGFTVLQIAKRLVKNGVVSDEAAFLNLVTNHGSTLRASFPLPANLEGFLFPDTYRFPVGADNEAVAQRMVENFDQRFAQTFETQITQSGRSITDIANVAAMVEKEAETNGDRAPIAGVIYNRLKRKMRLQIDATVQYAQGFHKNRLLYRDLTVASPYNTYKNAGLPPGPICNPGLPSLRAALEPAHSDYLFYVGTPDGSHIFSRTYAEHQANIVRVRKMPK